jgi:hypothetical protein
MGNDIWVMNKTSTLTMGKGAWWTGIALGFIPSGSPHIETARVPNTLV